MSDDLCPYRAIQDALTQAQWFRSMHHHTQLSMTVFAAGEPWQMLAVIPAHAQG